MMNRRTATGGLIATALPMTACTTRDPNTLAWPQGRSPLAQRRGTGAP